VSLEVSLLANVTNTPPERAALTRFTGRTADSPGATVTPGESMIPPPGWTRTVIDAAVTFGVLALAVIVAEPADTPVRTTFTDAALAAKVAVAGALATAVLFEIRFTTRPLAGAGDESVKVMFCGPVPLKVMAAGEKFRAARTWTAWLAAV
jgi:hypothetical protein